MSKHRLTDETNLQRRDVLGAGIAIMGGLAASAAAQAAGKTSAPARGGGVLGARLQGVQHFGLTVQNMDRAFTFYTQVLGGTEVLRDGDFQGERIHNTLLTDQEIEARARGVNPRAMGIPDLRSGAQRLDVRFIQFDNVVIELLQYRDADQPVGGSGTFAEPLGHMSPAFPRMMHICFHIRDDVDFNTFIVDLEAEAARRGMTQVKANRIITVRSEQERVAAPKEANSNAITEGLSDGWRLIYCKARNWDSHVARGHPAVGDACGGVLMRADQAKPVGRERGGDMRESTSLRGFCCSKLAGKIARRNNTSEQAPRVVTRPCSDGCWGR